MHEDALTITFRSGTMEVEALTLSTVDLDLEPIRKAAGLIETNPLPLVVSHAKSACCSSNAFEAGPRKVDLAIWGPFDEAWTDVKMPSGIAMLFVQPRYLG